MSGVWWRSLARGQPVRHTHQPHSNILHYRSALCWHCVIACMRVCVHLLYKYAWTLVDIYIYIKIWITFSISMYIMCVCLFSTLSCRAGALQISIIIILQLDTAAPIFHLLFFRSVCCLKRGFIIKNWMCACLRCHIKISALSKLLCVWISFQNALLNQFQFSSHPPPPLPPETVLPSHQGDQQPNVKGEYFVRMLQLGTY